MADKKNYDLFDEVNCSDSCEAIIAFCNLVDNLVKEIQHLELECIGTRYHLSKLIDDEHGELLRMDILENLARRFPDDPAYVLYKDMLYNGGDPMEFRDYLVKVRNASNGEMPCWY